MFILKKKKALYISFQIKCIAFLLLLCCCISCTENRVYTYSHTIENSTWNIQDTLIFQFQISDTSKVYDLNFEINNNNEFPNSNLWLFVQVTAPQGLYQLDTLNYYLSDETGKWLGKSIFGSSWENRFQYKNNIRFIAPGNYTISVKHGMRFDNLNGINNIGLQVIQN